MIIVGIDPGTATTGYSVIKVTKKAKSKKQQVVCLKYGTIKTSPKHSPEKRLNQLYLQLSKILKEYRPNFLVVEGVYFFKNLKTAFPVSEARGVILLSAAKKRLKVYQVNPLQVKVGVCGYGRATKKEVQKAVKKTLKMKTIPQPDDAADAIAIALYGMQLIQ